jgi:hypothetical protein
MEAGGCELKQRRQRDEQGQDDRRDLKDRSHDLDPESRPRGHFTNPRTGSGKDRPS